MFVQDCMVEDVFWESNWLSGRYVIFYVPLFKHEPSMNASDFVFMRPRISRISGKLQLLLDSFGEEDPPTPQLHSTLLFLIQWTG